MSGGSSRTAAWFTLLQPVSWEQVKFPRADDPRLGEIVKRWDGTPAALTPGRAVLVGFPVDKGVRRNGGRPGAAAAPQAIRRALARLSPWNGATGADLAACPPLDVGDIAAAETLEESQDRLAAVIGGILRSGAIPLVLGGGHETAYGHYLGYLQAGLPVGIINIDAHLDVRPVGVEGGHSGSPFRQALEHPQYPLPGDRYVCLGAQPAFVAREHMNYLNKRGGRVVWADQARGRLVECFTQELARLAALGCHIYVTLDADVVGASEVPGVSAPNPAGLDGSEILACVHAAGRSPHVRSLDVVEINPSLDRDEQSTRWAALAAWTFLAGVAERLTR